MDPARLKQLLANLKSEDAALRDQATSEFWHQWFHQKGARGAERLLESQALLEAGRLNEAGSILDELIAAQPDFAEAWNRRAVFHYLQGQYETAILDCQKVLALIPHHFGALHGLGLCQAAVGNHLAAIQAFRQALAVQPYALINQKLILECTAQL
ncbi:MAG: tetratricopeptide repeat protein [Leptolyngbya sp. SIO4C1]|nr:tetratricopeptide repeat protein [Leptolyngbya sp. SIO4C1]